MSDLEEIWHTLHILSRTITLFRFFYVVLGPLLAPIPNFIQIRRKTQKLKIFAVGRFWLVMLVGQKMAVAISNLFYVVFVPLLTPYQISSKTDEKYRHSCYLSVLIGRAGMSKNGCSHFKLGLCGFW